METAMAAVATIAMLIYGLRLLGRPATLGAWVSLLVIPLLVLPAVLALGASIAVRKAAADISRIDQRYPR